MKSWPQDSGSPGCGVVRLLELWGDELVSACFYMLLLVPTSLNRERMDNANHFMPFTNCTNGLDGFNGKQLGDPC